MNNNRWKIFFLANSLGAFILLFIVKLFLFLHTTSGAEGKIEIFKTWTKISLCLGWDVVGGFFLAAIIYLFIFPFRQFLTSTRALLIALPIHLSHGVYLVFSFFTNRTLGGPLDKTTIDLGFLNYEESVATSETGKGIWSSVGHYLTFEVFLLLAGSGLVSFIVTLLLIRWWPKITKITRYCIYAMLALLVIISVIVIPNIRNGEIFGVRIHTYGLERSHFVYLAGSYLKPLYQDLFKKQKNLADPFCLDMSSVVESGSLPHNPLLLEQNNQQNSSPKNLVVIILESVATVYLKHNPNPMPYLQKLAREEGVFFRAHYTTWPQTLKALFSFYCSENIQPHYLPISYSNPAIPCQSIMEVLRKAGWQTALFASDDLGYERKIRFLKNRKFHLMYDMHSMPNRENAWSISWGIDEQVTIKTMLHWTRQMQRKKAPFFAVYKMATGHHPYIFPGAQKPKPTLEEEHQAYLRSLTYIDLRVKEVVENLRQTDLLANTVVAIFADHGEAFNQHPEARSHGPHVYDEIVNVPLVLLTPNLPAKGAVVDFVTSHLDIAPTLLGLLGRDPPITMKGRDLTRNSQPNLAIFSGRPPNAHYGIRDGHWKLIEAEETGYIQLFDLHTDPGEKNNLAQQHPELASKLQKRLGLWKIHSANLIENYAQILRLEGHNCQTGIKSDQL